MSLKSDFTKIFRESFDVPRHWSEWFLDTVYRDDEVIAMPAADGSTASVALLTPTVMSFHDIELPATYVSCVATTLSRRGQGFAGRLMKEAIAESQRRGAAFALLIPAAGYLYRFYSHSGFSTVFYTSELRYTSLHSFDMPDDFVPVEPTYALLNRLELLDPNGVRHSPEDFRRIMRDIELDDGNAVAVSAADGRAAMAFVETKEDVAHVKAMLSTDASAAESVLALVRAEVGRKPLSVEVRPDDTSDVPLKPRGMARIVNAGAVLSALATSCPDLRISIRLHDPVIAENNALFVIDHGQCTPTPANSSTARRPDLDVGIDVLASALFSAPNIAEVLGLKPSPRPVINLMLD